MYWSLAFRGSVVSGWRRSGKLVSRNGFAMLIAQFVRMSEIWNCFVAVVGVHRPDKCECVRFTLDHSVPLDFKLKTIVIAVISESIILVPRSFVPNQYVGAVVLFTIGDRFLVSEAFVLEVRGCFPLICIEGVCGLVYVDAVRKKS